jgi:hypothetical protein
MLVLEKLAELYGERRDLLQAEELKLRLLHAATNPTKRFSTASFSRLWVLPLLAEELYFFRC